MLVAKLLLVLAVSLPVFHSVPKTGELLDKLREESGQTLEVLWNKETNTPELLTGQLTPPSNHSPGWISYAFLNKIKPLYDLKRVNDDMKIMSIDRSDPDRIKVLMERQLYGKPVCGNYLHITLNGSGVIQRVEGVIHPEIEEKRLGRPMYPAVTPEKAKKIASAYVSSQFSDLSREPAVRSCYLPDREGVPLIHTVTFTKQKTPATVTVKIHSLTGRVID